MSQYDKEFPYPNSKKRIERYGYNHRLLKGNHFDAFAVQGGKGFSESYSRLRYVVCNFAGLVSKVIADFVFGEAAKIKVDKNQDWVDNLYFKNKMQTQNYESAITNSALGDAVYKIRVEDNEIIIEDIPASLYFPHLNEGNVRDKPKVEEIAFIETHSDKDRYLIREIHSVGFVRVKIFKMDGNKIKSEIDINTYNGTYGTEYQEEVKTNIKHNLIVHVPNYRITTGYFGISDYQDIDELLFALNNRMTKIDNILDTHSDPILAVPEGVLDENGIVKKEHLGLFEVTEEGKKPEYIVWNASLESAFSEIEKLVEFLFMFSETSPQAFGLGKDAPESGRALKMRLLRTVAKKKRKQLYYDQGLKEVFFIAQELAKANGYTVNGEKLPSDPEVPEIIFTDKVVADERETTENEAIKLENGTTSKERAIMKQENMNEEEAEALLDEIDKEDTTTSDFLTNAN